MIESRVVVVGLSIVVLYLLWARVNKTLFNDFFSPFNLIYFFWILPILIRGLNLSWLEQPWNYKTILAVSMVTFIFVAVSLFPLRRKKRLPSLHERGSFFPEMLKILQDHRISFILVAFFVFLFVLFIYVEFLTNPAGFELIQRLLGNLRPEDVSYYGWGKNQGRTTLTSLAITLTSFLLVLNPIFYLKSRASRMFLAKIIFLSISFATTLFGFIKLSKTDVMISLWGIVLAEHYYRRFTAGRNRRDVTLPKRTVIILLVLVIPVLISFILTATVRLGDFGGGQYGSIYMEWIECKLEEPNLVNSVACLLYVYTAINFENVNRFINSYDGGFNLGISFFRPLLSIFTEGDLADSMLNRIDFNTLDPAIAGTFMILIFAELSWIGLLVVPLIYAGLVNMLYRRFREKPSFSKMFLYLNFSFCWVFIFFTNPFDTLIFYTNAAFIIILGHVFAVWRRRFITHPNVGRGKVLPYSEIA